MLTFTLKELNPLRDHLLEDISDSMDGHMSLSSADIVDILWLEREGSYDPYYCLDFGSIASYLDGSVDRRKEDLTVHGRCTHLMLVRDTAACNC
jgi:hypothetical protein